MAGLIKCKTCGNDVALSATACPKCGAPVPKGWLTPAKIVLGAIGGLFLMCIVLGVIGAIVGGGGGSAGGSEAPTRPSAPSTAAPPEQAISITPRELASAYVENEIAADKRFKGKLVRMQGTVDKIGKDILDTPYVVLRSGQSIMREVQCFFEDDQLPKLEELRPGAKVVVQGRVDGLMGNILIKDSKFLTPEGTR